MIDMNTREFIEANVLKIMMDVNPTMAKMGESEIATLEERLATLDEEIDTIKRAEVQNSIERRTRRDMKTILKSLKYLSDDKRSELLKKLGLTVADDTEEFAD